jgi:hypothetical protein
MKINIRAVNRELVKKARKARKDNVKADNKKNGRSVKSYYDTFDI